MKKILLSLLVIAMVSSVAVIGASSAWFSETESTAGDPTQPTKNSITAGTIELDIEELIIIEDLKPCWVDWGYIKVCNVGTNVGDFWIHIANVMNEEGELTDAELDAYLERSGGDPDALRYDNDLERFITVDMNLDYYMDDIKVAVPPGQDHNWQLTDPGGDDVLIIDESEHWKLAMLDCQWIPLGTLDPGECVYIWLSFHIQPEAGNQYQGDIVTFDLEVLLQQQNAPPPGPQFPSSMRVLRLENKVCDAGPAADANWDPIIDGTYATVAYDSQAGPDFDWALEGYGLQNNTEYELIYYADPWPGNGDGLGAGALIGNGTTNGFGRLSIAATSTDLSMDMPNVHDWNDDDGAKLWLVPATDYDQTTNSMVAWNCDDYLYEMKLISHHDTDVP